MVIKGISESKLVSDLYENKNQNVPVGKTILYNDLDKLPEEAKPLNAGEPITNLDLSQFDAFGIERQTLSTKRDSDTDEVTFSERAVVNDGLLVEGAFKEEDGCLVLVKANGEVLEVDGFLRQSDFGSGPPGTKGDIGYDGDYAFDGRDGKEGDDGCGGSDGSEGDLGTQGNTGDDGPPGVSGPPGQVGQKGVQGSIGNPGRIGQEGARGPRGSRCDGGGQGPTGADGVSPYDTVVITSSTPDSLTLIWAIPE
jgi:hypothetical protein